MKKRLNKDVSKMMRKTEKSKFNKNTKKENKNEIRST